MVSMKLAQSFSITSIRQHTVAVLVLHSPRIALTLSFSSTYCVVILT